MLSYCGADTQKSTFYCSTAVVAKTLIIRLTVHADEVTGGFAGANSAPKLSTPTARAAGTLTHNLTYA